MQRQYIHLPNLNSLYLQNTLYQKHRQKLIKSKSTYQSPKNIGLQSKEVHERYRQVLALKEKDKKANETERSPLLMLKEKILMKYQSLSPTNRYESRITPHQKRKLSERNQENHRLYEALHFSIPIVSAGSTKANPQHQALKARISKFTREGNLVVYKFKKSLAQITRQRQHKKAPQNRLYDPIYQAKQKLSNLIQYRSKPNLEGTSSSTDLYVNLQESNQRYPSSQPQDLQTAEEGYYSKQSSIDRSFIHEFGVKNIKDQYSKSQRCKTDPSQSTFTVPCRQLRSKRKVGNYSRESRVIEHKEKKISNIYLMPKSDLLIKNKSRPQLNDMEIVCLPQIKKGQQ